MNERSNNEKNERISTEATAKTFPNNRTNVSPAPPYTGGNVDKITAKRKLNQNKTAGTYLRM